MSRFLHTMVRITDPERLVLRARLESALNSLLADNVAAVCAALRLYELAVQFASATAFTPTEKATLIAESRGIRSDLGRA